ncbi:MAG TPA: SGNH/GDSL hydrolase family protein [Polyangiaceae bacterium]|nr:SGNH/GDSL hydrolase family protein [Polyangiaceae bacterium]
MCGFFGCHAAERAEPDSHSPPQIEAAASSAPSPTASLAPSAAPAATDRATPNKNPEAANQDAGATPSAARRYVVAAVGDSLTDPRSHGGGYLEYVKARCPNLELDNFGRGATMVNQMRKSFDEQIASSPKQYTHLIVFGGVNDLYSDLTAHRTPAKIETDLDYIYSAAKARGMKVVALTVAPWGGFTRYFNPSRAEATHTLNAWIREQPAHGHVDAVVDAFKLLSCGDPDVLCERFFAPFKDGIHFGPGGHQLLGEALYRAVFADCS